MACPCHVARGAAPHSSAAVVRNRSRGTERFVEEHQGRIGDISVFGQESNPTTWKLAPMNLAIRGIEAHLGQKWADSFLDDQPKDLKADSILANPPFNVSDWSGYMGQNSFLAFVKPENCSDTECPAKLRIRQNGEMVEVDSRPSDAIALAVTAKVPIYVAEDVLDEVCGE